MGGASLLLLATYRPEYRLPWLGKSYVTQLSVPPLAPQDSLRVVRAVLQTEQVPDHLARIILAKADWWSRVCWYAIRPQGPVLSLPLPGNPCSRSNSRPRYRRCWPLASTG
jgi:hypothetical protein